MLKQGYGQSLHVPLNAAPLRMQVVERSNKSCYGLAAGVFTKNLDSANYLSRALRVGTVWINTFDNFDASIPFGGYKMSGVGREHGQYALENFTQVGSAFLSHESGQSLLATIINTNGKLSLDLCTLDACIS